MSDFLRLFFFVRVATFWAWTSRNMSPRANLTGYLKNTGHFVPYSRQGDFS